MGWLLHGQYVAFPFNDRGTCGDILSVQINSVERVGTPRSAQEIMNRVNQITFNSSLLKELRAIEFVGRQIYEGALDESPYRKLRLHLLDDHDELTEMGASSKLKAEKAFLDRLFEIG